jgi:hypothetical protein
MLNHVVADRRSVNHPSAVDELAGGNVEFFP